MIDIKERLRFHGRFGNEDNNQQAARKAAEREEAADHIEQQEAEIARLHSSLAGAVQHGVEGWNRYNSANQMCNLQQKEIAGLNEGIAMLRKDAVRTTAQSNAKYYAQFSPDAQNAQMADYEKAKREGL